MHEDESKHKQGPRHLLVTAAVALGCLLLMSRFLPSGFHSVPETIQEPQPPRQRVVIFLVDTSDAFDAHGVYVRSVLQQQCSRCDVQPVNLHSDLSLPAIIQALQHVQDAKRAFGPSTTVLVNLSLGTYTQDAGLHTMVHRLAAEGVLLLASAGNDNTSKPFYPAAFPEVLGICSSTRYSKTKAAYSNFGDWVSLCAPGLQVVTQPLQHGEVASGTSFASPMVAGVLGNLLLEAPCTPPDGARQALLRTAEPVPTGSYPLGAGVLNAARAGQYVQRLYACQRTDSTWQRLLARGTRLATRLGISLSLVLYFFASIFTVPFLLAFAIERCQRQAAERHQQTIQQAYLGPPAYRQQRFDALKQAFLRRHKLRRQHQAELFALLHAVHAYGEACGWCGRTAAEAITEAAPASPLTACSRCGMTLQTPSANP